jgi:CMP-N,N'-diacetyllegionaminic acid synthase
VKADAGILGLIPARGGSRAIPRKNIKRLNGKPLIAWTIEAALRSNSLGSVVVSTDDEEIARIAAELGAEVPFMRPRELARDDSPSIDLVLHALDQLPGFESVVLLQPTSPLRTTEDIDGCIELASDRGALSVVSVSPVGTHPFLMYRLGENQRLEKLVYGPPVSRRQDLPPVFALNGAVYFAGAEWLRQYRTFVSGDSIGYVMPAERSVDLDTLLDWQLAELALTENPIRDSA